MHRLVNVVFGSKTNRFAAIDFGEDDNETENTQYKIASKDELDALDRLSKAGFSLNSNAMQRFAADYDIPGPGKSVMPELHTFKPISR